METNKLNKIDYVLNRLKKYSVESLSMERTYNEMVNYTVRLEIPSFSDEPIKYMDIKEFRENGYLQEVNRQFLHPLGLALEIKQDDLGNEILSGIWDYRDDPEGIIFDIKNSDEKRQKAFWKKFLNINNEKMKRFPIRKKNYGAYDEPIIKIKD